MFTGGNKRGQGHRMVPLPPLDSPKPSFALTHRRCAAKRGLRGLGSVRRAGFGRLSGPEFTLRDLQRCQCAARRCRALDLRCEKLRFHQVLYLGAPNVPVGSSHFRRATEGSRVLRKVRGVKRGKKTLVVFPLLPPAVGTAFPGPPKAAIAHAHFERQVASTGCAAVSAEGLPSAEEKEKRAASPGRDLTPAFLCHKKFTPLRVENPRRS